ncbi:MAG: sensor histidine kinase [Roseburia sp.]
MIIFVCWLAVLVGLLTLNGVPAHETVYGVMLCLFFLLVILVWDAGLRYQRYRQLRQMEKSVDFSLEGMPEPGDTTEEEYQKLLAILLDEKRRMEEAAQRKESNLREYYTMWVHQIKTPIAALRLLLQEKNQEGGSSEELGELFYIEQYVKMALQYARLDSETTDFDFREVELDAVIREAVHRYAGQFVRGRISLNYDRVDTRVLTDEKWLEFVMEQLLSNALKYTPKGSISIYMEEGCLVIEDTGIGIRAEDLPRVCEKGYTGYNGHVDKRSTGIGLYLCQRILTKLGHTLTITSQEGEGTRVLLGFETE